MPGGTTAGASNPALSPASRGRNEEVKTAEEAHPKFTPDGNSFRMEASETLTPHTWNDDFLKPTPEPSPTPASTLIPTSTPETVPALTSFLAPTAMAPMPAPITRTEPPAEIQLPEKPGAPILGQTIPRVIQALGRLTDQTQERITLAIVLAIAGTAAIGVFVKLILKK